MNILVLGLGNILLSDEGVGVRVIESLMERHRLPDNVEVIDGGTSGMDLLNTIAGRDHLIVCDAIKADADPGSVLRLAGDEVPAFFQTKMSPHQLGLCDVLATLKLIDEMPAEITLIGIVPEDLSLSTELSAKATVARELAATLILDELAALGAPADSKATAIH